MVRSCFYGSSFCLQHLVFLIPWAYSLVCLIEGLRFSTWTPSITATVNGKKAQPQSVSAIIKPPDKLLFCVANVHKSIWRPESWRFSWTTVQLIFLIHVSTQNFGSRPTKNNCKMLAGSWRSRQWVQMQREKRLLGSSEVTARSLKQKTWYVSRLRNVSPRAWHETCWN